jgi:hypothetical protein
MNAFFFFKLRGVIGSIPSNTLISTEIKKWRVCRALCLDDVFLLAETISWRALIFGNGFDTFQNLDFPVKAQCDHTYACV